MLTACLKKLIKRENLSYEDAFQALTAIITLKNPAQISAFLVLMRAKGETAEEMTAFVQCMQQQQVNVNIDFPVLDIVGTGGDAVNTANISTAASILAASCGVPVLKHGNRAVSSQSGAADVLQALGLTLEKSPQQVAKSLIQHQIGFCFAPIFHPVLLALKPIRSELKVPTFFNLLGPLLNPGKAQYLILGVFSASLQDLMADIVLKLGVKRALIVHGNGLDELNCLGPCQVIEINEGQKHCYQIDALELGLPRCQLDDLIGGDAFYNAKLLQAIIENKKSHLANTVMLNAAAAVYIYGRAQTMKASLALVQENMANGNAKNTLESFIHA